MLGCLSSAASTQSRSSALLAKWTQTNVVFGCRAITRSSASTISIRGGYIFGSPNHQLRWSFNSLHRSFLSLYGSQNALGSATWIETGMPSSPHFAQTGSSFGSSTLISFPLPSRRKRPSRLNSFRPAAPRRWPSSICFAALGRSRRRRSRCSRGSCSGRTGRGGWRRRAVFACSSCDGSPSLPGVTVPTPRLTATPMPAASMIRTARARCSGVELTCMCMSISRFSARHCSGVCCATDVDAQQENGRNGDDSHACSSG